MRHQMVTHAAEAVFHALADPTRRAVLDLLRSNSLPAGQIARSFPISRPAISKHLRLLRRANLVREHRSGRHRFYHLNPQPLKAVDLWLEQYRVFWNMKLADLKAFVESGHVEKVGGVRKKNKMKQGDIAMKASSVVTLFALLVCASPGQTQSSPQRSFDVLKSLQGKWQGKDTLGHPVKATFRLTAKGSALMSEYVEPNQNEDMISIFHVDGDRLLMIHYCSAGNQPRMKATASPDGKTITFDFVDATNLASPWAGHMRRFVIKILSPKQHTEEWTYVENGKDDVVVADMRRAK